MNVNYYNDYSVTELTSTHGQPTCKALHVLLKPTGTKYWNELVFWAQYDRGTFSTSPMYGVPKQEVGWTIK
jgi:hypothetical protein